MKLHHIDGYIQSIYLVEYPDKVLLLDGCAKADIPMLKHYFKHVLARPMTDVTTIIVTHMHPDHAGGAQILKKLTGAKLVSAHKDTQWYGGVSGICMYLMDVLLMRMVAYLQNKPQKTVMFWPYLKPDCMVKEGDAVPEFPDWSILITAGHTDRDLSVYHAESGQIYVADLMVKTKTKYIVPFPIYHPNTYRQSLEKLNQIQPKKILMAHGGSATFDASIINELIKTMPHKRTNIFWLVLHIFKKLKNRGA